MRWMLLMLVIAFSAALLWTPGCSCDDDDDDNDDGGDDDDDDDDDDDADDDMDDDTADEFPCEDAYDVIVDGQTDFGGGNVSEWTAKLVIADDGTITGTIIPDDETMDPYDVTGFRHDETTGEVDGNFPTPDTLIDLCDQATVYNHMDFTVIEGALTGTVTFYCGTVDEANLMGTWDAEGAVTCGDYSA